ncbi:MAG: AAA family ATPase [Planctomycetota bacterium]
MRAQERLEQALQAEGPVIHVRTADEARVLTLLQTAADRMPEGGWALQTWSCTRGWAPGWGAEGDTRDPVVALRVVASAPPRQVFVLRDLTPHLEGPAALRAMRELYYALQDDPLRVVVSVGLAPDLPEPLDRSTAVVELGPPDEEELERAVRARLAGLVVPALQAELGRALRGLGMDEVRAVLRRIAASGAISREDLLAAAFSARTRSAGQGGALEFVPPRWTVDGIGGLERLKEWLTVRKELFSGAAVEQGLPTPRGLLLMGVSGCGKSFAAKAVSALWGVPLVRLDMNLVFSSLYGSPEAAFYRTLRCAEGLAPVVVWIDEIENGLSASGGEAQQHLFSAFLTWLQEKPPLVFVVATANRIEDLPAELLRKGRFDQVFFCDLPTGPERSQIFELHLRRNGADPAAFRSELLVQLTRRWSGAEIEQAILGARLEGRRHGRRFDERDLLRSIEQLVPLSRTMAEQIRALREWAYGRATPASAPPEPGEEGLE